MRDFKSKLISLIPLIIVMAWFMRTGSRGITYWFDPATAADVNEFDYLKGSPLDRGFLIALEAAGAIVLMFRKIDWKLFLKENKWIIILYVYMGISIIWSDFQGVSFKRWIRTCGDLIMVMIVITELSYTETATRILRYSSYILIPISVLFIKYLREYGVTYDFTGTMEMWVGVTTHKNSLGQLACMSSIFFIWIFFAKYYIAKIWDIPVLIMALWLLNGSSSATSRTSLGVFFFGVILFFLMVLMRNRVVILKTTLGILLPTVLIASFVSSYFYSQNLFTWVIAKTGGDPTLTGRTFLWTEVLKIASHYQPFGSGYGGFWIGGLANNLWEIFIWHPGQAHNGYIDVYVDIGIVGLLLFVIVLISVFRHVFDMLEADSDFGRLRITVLSMILVYNITESSFIKPTSLLWFLFLLFALRVPEKFPEYKMKMERELQSR